MPLPATSGFCWASGLTVPRIVPKLSLLGAVTPPIADGEPSGDELPYSVVPPAVLVGGVPAQAVAVVSPEFVGVHQVNVTVPQDAPTGDTVALQIRMGEFTSTREVTIALEAVSPEGGQ